MAQEVFDSVAYSHTEYFNRLLPNTNLSRLVWVKFVGTFVKGFLFVHSPCSSSWGRSISLFPLFVSLCVGQICTYIVVIKLDLLLKMFLC